VPRLAVGSFELEVENVFVILPGLIQHESAFTRRIAVQDCLAKHGFASHRVENTFQQLKKLAAPLRHDLKFD
jgi:hypothetical protein